MPVQWPVGVYVDNCSPGPQKCCPVSCPPTHAMAHVLPKVSGGSGPKCAARAAPDRAEGGPVQAEMVIAVAGRVEEEVGLARRVEAHCR